MGNFVGTAPGVLLIDRCGRKPLLIISATTMALCAAIISGVGISTLEFPEHCFSDSYRHHNRVLCATTKGFDPTECIPNQEAVNRQAFIDKCPIDTSVNPFEAQYTSDQCACGANVASYFQIVL